MTGGTFETAGAPPGVASLHTRDGARTIPDGHIVVFEGAVNLFDARWCISVAFCTLRGSV